MARGKGPHPVQGIVVGKERMIREKGRLRRVLTTRELKAPYLVGCAEAK